MSISNLFLKQNDPASISAFPKQYDQYRHIIARAKQLQFAEGTSTTTTEDVLPMKLTYFVDAKNFISCIIYGFIKKVAVFDEMLDKQLGAYVYSESE